jgi:hypothetical protein
MFKLIPSESIEPNDLEPEKIEDKIIDLIKKSEFYSLTEVNSVASRGASF